MGVSLLIIDLIRCSDLCSQKYQSKGPQTEVLRFVMHSLFLQRFGKHTIYSNYMDVNATPCLREHFAPDLVEALVPTWNFLQSFRNITIERSWRPVFETWGVNILTFYNSGLYGGDFEQGNEIHRYVFILHSLRSIDDI